MESALIQNHLDNPTVLTPKSPAESGSALVMVLGLSLVIGTLLMGAITTTVLQAKTMRHELDSTYALGLAEGAIELAHKTIVDEVANFRSPPLSGTTMLDGNSINWTATPVDELVERIDDDGLRSICQPYELSTTVSIGTATSRITRIVDLTLSPIYQYALFYNLLCEVNPVAELHIQGRVHVNGDLYLDTPTEITIDTDHLQATGGIYRGRLDGDPLDGKVEIRVKGDDDFEELEEDADSSSPGWVQSSLSEWGGSVQSGAHGAQRIAPPELAAIQPGGYYEENAGLRIIGDSFSDASGAPLVLPPGVIRNETFFDAREGKRVTVTSIDLQALALSGLYPTNGLIYARRTDASPSQPNGIRLFNGSHLPTPLTVVTENPLYIQGDFNTIEKKPASVIADAVNLLSNSWVDKPDAAVKQREKLLLKIDELEEADADDSEENIEAAERKLEKLEDKPTLRAAETTTFNLSLIAGIVFEDGVASGGFENFVRLHENWTDETLSILGALVVLYESQIATSPFDPGAFLEPIRSFAFDPDLLDPTFLPPYSPNAVSLRRVYWDDHKRIAFKVSDASLSLFPMTPIYDPWNYDGTFMEGVIDDPNEYLLVDSQVDYSDKDEAEAPETEERDIVTAAEQRKILKERIKDAKDLAKDARKDAKDALKDGDLLAAQAALLLAEAQLALAQQEFAASGNHRTLKKEFQKVEKEVEKARGAIEEFLRGK